MKLTESAIRKIIKEEAKRALNENDMDSTAKRDPVYELRGYMADLEEYMGVLDRYMLDIEDLFKGGYDHDNAMEEAEGMVADAIERMPKAPQLEESFRDWLYDYLKETNQDEDEEEDF